MVVVDGGELFIEIPGLGPKLEKEKPAGETSQPF